MRISSNAYRDTKHPGDLHEFLNRALLEEIETERVLARENCETP